MKTAWSDSKIIIFFALPYYILYLHAWFLNIDIWHSFAVLCFVLFLLYLQKPCNIVLFIINTSNIDMLCYVFLHILILLSSLCSILTYYLLYCFYIFWFEKLFIVVEREGFFYLSSGCCIVLNCENGTTLIFAEQNICSNSKIFLQKIGFPTKIGPTGNYFVVKLK